MRALYDLIIEHDDTTEGHKLRDTAVKAIKNTLNQIKDIGYDIEYDQDTSDWLNEGDQDEA